MPNFDLPRSEINRRRFLRASGLVAAAFAGLPATKLFANDKITMPFANGERRLVKYPQKRQLILVTARPPQLETPMSVFNEGVITPNDAFFVRYHLADIPLSIDPETFRLDIKGSVDAPQSFSLADLQKFEAVELVAVCQC